MRPLVLNDDVAKAAMNLAAFASERGHWYEPGVSAFVPGERPEYVLAIDHGFRCVFTLTKHKGKLWRHLSISVPSEKYPSHQAAFTIAGMFGFTGAKPADVSGPVPVITEPGPGWHFDVNEADRCVVIVQEVEGAQA